MGSANDLPSRTAALMSTTASAMTTFPEADATMSSDSITGTPDCSSEERVEANRASTALWVSPPKIGGFILKASHLIRPFSVLIHQRSVMTPPMMTATTRPARQLINVLEIVIKIRVGRGSWPPRVENNFLKMGTITTIMTRKMMAMTETTTIG